MPMATDRLDAQTILVVEDEPFILLEIQRTLEEVGARVLAARSVQEAQALLVAEHINASILDYLLQGGTADELCHQLTALKIPFVIYSGYPNVNGDSNKWEIVPKPADPRLLVTRVLSVLVASAVRASMPLAP